MNVYVLLLVKDKMGQSLETVYNTWRYPDVSPDSFGDATYSHDYGFPAERKKRRT